MKDILLWLWCLPQNTIGGALAYITKAEKKGNHFRFSIKCGSISLGEYIFLCPDHYRDITVLRHEHGHRVQSRILGWLYLPIIGIPSLIWAGFYSIFGAELKKIGIPYYWWYTEKWADHIAGIDRSKE